MDVVGFLLQNNYFPRSVAHCLDQVEECIGNLPQHQDTLKPVRKARRRVDRIKPDKLDTQTLHSLVDHLQIDMSAVHDQICKTWFE